MIIVCDIDCVLNNLCEKMLEIYNARSGKNIQVSDITSYDFKECLPKDDADDLYSLFKEKVRYVLAASAQGAPCVA